MKSIDESFEETTLVGKILTFENCDEIGLEAIEGMLATVESAYIEDGSVRIDFQCSGNMV